MLTDSSIEGQAHSTWSFRQRRCSSPLALGDGKRCTALNAETASVTNIGNSSFGELYGDELSVISQHAEYDVAEEGCRHPWQLARESPIALSDQHENCECGCDRTVDSRALAVFSPAPWKCSEPILTWKFTCNDCDTTILHVLHLDLDPTEGVYISENDKQYRITQIGSTHHPVKQVTISYVRSARPGCGFAMRLAFNRGNIKLFHH